MSSISSIDIAIDIAPESTTVKRLNQHVGAFLASLGGFVLGVAIGWNSSAGETLRSSLNASATEISLVGSGLYIGTSVGTLLLPFFLKCLSYTEVMTLTIPPSIIGWAMICLANQKVLFLTTGRIICGLSSGVHGVLAPLYIAEIADRKVRDRLLLIFHLLLNCGILYAFAVAYVIKEEEAIWRYSLICAVPCAVISLVTFLPDSPLHHLVTGDEHNAIKSLKWYRGRKFDWETELYQFKKLAWMRIEPQDYVKLLSSGKFLKSFFLCLWLMMVQQLSGVNIIIFHALTIFNVGGSGDMSGSEQTLVIGSVQIASCILAIILIDVLGRRALLTISLMLMGLFLVLLGWFIDAKEKDLDFEDRYFWMAPAWITLLFAAFNIGIGPISWSLLGDSFPTEFKVAVASSIVAFSWAISFVADMIFGDVIVTLGMTKTMFLFAILCWMSSAFASIFVEDTNNKSLAEIQEDFKLSMYGET